MVARLPLAVALLCLLATGLPAVAGAAVAKNVSRVIADFRNDGRIEPCRHTPKAYRDTLKEVEADTERYAPDFPIAVQAAREARVDADCAAEEEQEADADDDGSASPTATATPAPSVAPAAPVTPVTPATPVTPDPAPPVSSATPAPLPSSTPAPSPTPTPEPAPVAPAPPGTGAGITPGVPPPADNRPDVVLTRTSDNSGARVPLAILAGVMAAALLAGMLALLMRRFGWGEERLAGMRHSWSEASYRTGGTWQDFTDWMRLGR